MADLGRKCQKIVDFVRRAESEIQTSCKNAIRQKIGTSAAVICLRFRNVPQIGTLSEIGTLILANLLNLSHCNFRLLCRGCVVCIAVQEQGGEGGRLQRHDHNSSGDHGEDNVALDRATPGSGLRLRSSRSGLLRLHITSAAGLLRTLRIPGAWQYGT